MLKQFFEHFRLSRKTIAESASEKSQRNEKDNSQDDAFLSTDKIKAIISELNSANSIFTQAGFSMEKLDVEIGTASKITPHFQQIQVISSEDESRVLSLVDDSSIVKFVLMSLFRSTKMEALFDDTELCFHQVSINIATLPSVITTFKKLRHADENIEVTRH